MLLLTFRLVDGRVPLAFGRQNHRAFFPFRPHLFFHGVQDVLRRGDVLDFISEDFDAPGFRRLVEFVDDLRVDVGPLLECPVQIDFADFAAQVVWASWDNGEAVIADAVRGALGVETLRYRTPSTPTCTLSRVMQICSGMSMAVSLRECLYSNHIDEWNQNVESRA